MITGRRLSPLAALCFAGVTLVTCTTEPAPIASVVVTPATSTLTFLGETVQLSASAQDASGNTLPGMTFTWSASDQSIATVSASGLVTAVGYGSATITASADGRSGTATINVEQAATQLAFAVDPTAVAVGASIAPAVEVAIQDAMGSLVASATDAVTVAIGTNPGGGALSGTTTVIAVAGIARFADLSIDQGGAGYRLVATSGTLSWATSAAFDVSGNTVNSADDVDDGACNTTHCSLREALHAANANPGTDGIVFDIAGAGPHTIRPASALPTITAPVVIDGYSQSGASVNTNGPDLGSNAVLMIELDGSAAGSGAFGLVVEGGNSTFRGLVINRFDDGAILVQGPAGGNVIEGCFLGTDVTGTVGLANLSGVLINGVTNNTVGGTDAAARNVISANTFDGITIMNNGATGNRVQGNLIGTDITGGSALSNGVGGVVIFDAQGNTVGGTVPEARNIISGNIGSGLEIQGSDAFGHQATMNLVHGNFIGTDITGTSGLGNTGAGVLINGASGNTVGGTGPGEANAISFNGLDGVAVTRDGAETAVLANAIFSNGDQGIDLDDDGVSPNDAGDSDTGANDLQNFPVLTSATSGNGSITITGDLNGTMATDFRIEFFRNTACNPSGNGEGEAFLGSTMVSTDDGGNASFMVTLTATVPVGQLVTATATDSNGNTSEFSPCATVSG